MNDILCYNQLFRTMNGAVQREVITFGVFEVHLHAHELRKHGIRIKLHGQPFALLTMFLERPGEVVTREEIQARLWAEDTYVDFERSTNAAVKKLRAALGDVAENPIYIETLPRIGYRFIAPVRRVIEPSEIPPAAQAPQDSTASTAYVPSSDAPPARRRTMWILAAGVAVALAVVGVLRFGIPSKPVLAETDRVVLGPFVNKSGDSSFDDVLIRDLRVKLSESPYLNLVSEAETRRAAGKSREAGKADGAPEDLAKECRDLRATAWIDGQVEASGQGFSVALTATRCAGASRLVHVERTAATADEVREALGAATSELRIALGEPKSSVAKFDTPSVLATTSSLAALKAFSQAEEKRAEGLDYETLPDYRLATDLDPKFALAFARMGTIYGNAQEFEQARRNLDLAFSLRDHASERERLYITAHYYSGRYDLDNTARTYDVWRQVYPRDVTAANNLAQTYIHIGQLEKAVEMSRAAVALEPGNAFCQATLLQALQRAGQYTEAKSVYESMSPAAQNLQAHLTRYDIALGEGKSQDMETQLQWAGKNSRFGELLDHRASAEAKFGRIALARELFRQASDGGKKGGLSEYAALVLLDEAQIDADFGYEQQAAARVDEALRINGASPNVKAFAALPLARIGMADRARQLAMESSDATPQDTVSQHIVLPMTRAALDLHEKQVKKAVDELETVRPYDWSTDANLASSYYRGEALMAAERWRDAAREFERVIEKQLTAPNSIYPALAQLGKARAYTKGGDPTRGRPEYETFFALWKNADPDIPLMRSAKAEFAALGR